MKKKEVIKVNKKAIIMVILAGLLWGTSGIFVHFLSPLGFDTMQIICMRGIVSVIAMCIYALVFDRSIFKLTKVGFIYSLFSGTAMFFCGYTYYASMRASSVSTAVVLMYTAPILVMAFSVLFLGEKLTKIKAVTVFMMILGCAMVSGIFGNAKFGYLGVFLGLCAGISYATYNVLTKLQMGLKLNPASCTMYCFVVMTVISIVFANPAEMVSIAKDNLKTTIPLAIGVGLCTNTLPYFLYALSLRKLPVGTASALSIVEPIASTVYSVALLGEKLSLISLAGIIMIISSVFLLSRSKE